LCAGGVVPRAEAQSFISGSDGSDQAFEASGPAGTVIVFDPSQFGGSQVSANVFNFTTITIAAGVTVRVPGKRFNGPLVWLAQGDVAIAGTLDLRGGPGHDATVNAFTRTPSEAGPGGYAGGVGGSSEQAPLPGSGPGGGTVHYSGNSGGPGTFSGNAFLVPLVGGSGGAGAREGGSTFGAGGGGGGGAILIASSGHITVNGAINAVGGRGGLGALRVNCGGGGSGGAIRLVSNTITGTGSLNASGGAEGGGSCGGVVGSTGRVRLEAYDIPFTGSTIGSVSHSAPFALLVPTTGPPTARVIKINGLAVSADPTTFPDVTINTTSAVPVVIETHNIPISATINLTILNQNGVGDTTIQAPPLGNCDGTNTCTTTVDVVFPFGASRGLTKVTWTQ
jgi:hypothetical protein